MKVVSLEEPTFVVVSSPLRLWGTPLDGREDQMVQRGWRLFRNGMEASKSFCVVREA